MVKAHLECLEKASKGYGDMKGHWFKALGAYPSKIKPGAGTNLVEKLERRRGTQRQSQRVKQALGTLEALG